MQKTDDDAATALGMMQLHQKNVHDRKEKESKQKPPKVDRPTVAWNMSEAEWKAFDRQWDMFEHSTDLEGVEIVQLLKCCPQDMQDKIHGADERVKFKPKSEIMAAIKSLAVVKVPLTTRRTHLLESISQDHKAHFLTHIRGRRIHKEVGALWI